MPEQPPRRNSFRFLLQLLTIGLLVSMLVTQLMILARMPLPPPTLKDLMQPGADKAQFMKSLPLVRVQGEVEVQNMPLEVEVQNMPLRVEVENMPRMPLKVEVENMPLQVEVQR